LSTFQRIQQPIAKTSRGGCKVLQFFVIALSGNGLEAIHRYYKELKNRSEISKRVKVVFIGNGKAGKTSLRNVLKKRIRPFTKEEDRTILLDLDRVTIDRNDSEPLELMICF